MKKVVFLGLGYIGLPTAAVAAAHGFEVIGVDVNPSVVETINQGKIHIVEPELGQVVRDKCRVESYALYASRKRRMLSLS